MASGVRSVVSLVVVVMTVAQVSCKPVNRSPPSPHPPVDKDPNASHAQNDKGTGLEYDRYLQQVVEVLESDVEFRKKLESANVSDIKSGAIAEHLRLVNGTIRTKLDEIKRMEIQRLQQLARLRNRVSAGGRVNRMEIPGHLDLRNPHSFEVKDLENLILKTTKDLEEVDEKRRKDFKAYEMEKEFKYQERLKDMPEEERFRAQQEHDRLQQKHKEHDKIQHPGSKDQFEEVWEKEDKMEDQDFDPKTFFMMHDLNEDIYWDIQEVEAVLQRELEKVYDARNSPEEDDPVEREEEMNRMREHVFSEVDTDKDLMISIQEFLQYTGRHGENKKFEENEGWETVDEKPAFTDEEYQEYIRQHHAQPGVVPPPVESDLQFQPEQQLRQQQQQESAQQAMPQAVHQAAPHQPQDAQHGQPGQGPAPQGVVEGQGEAPQGMGNVQGEAPQGMAQQPVSNQPEGQEVKPQELQHPPQQPVASDQAQPLQGQPDQGQGQPL